MSEISKLEPRRIWELFDQITKTPRPSKKEEKIVKYLIDFAKSHKLAYKKDAAGNVMISRKASASKVNSPTVVLQSHADMVCEKNSDVVFDFENDPIQTYIEDGWVRARGTTLGADDGIGMAATLAILIEENAELPAIEGLFTVDEETGLTGAFNLGADMLTGKYLINLDSEDEGELFVGCAGGIGTIATFKYKDEKAPEKHLFFKVQVSGLKGGHSGDDIEKGHANSNKLMTRLMLLAQREVDARICRIEGGNLHNVIPREAYSLFGVPAAKVKKLFEIVDKFTEETKSQYSITEPNMEVMISEEAPQLDVIDLDTQRKLLSSLQGVQNGVLAMSFAMPGLVETSSNLASVKFGEGKTIVITTSQRSSVNSARFDVAASIASIFTLAGATVKHTAGYPGWNPNLSSHLLAVTKKCYKTLFATEPKIKAIHAGLECGLFLEKYPHLEMVSFGPTVRGAHSPDERMEIESVEKFWKLLLATLSEL